MNEKSLCVAGGAGWGWEGNVTEEGESEVSKILLCFTHIYKK